MDGRGPSLIGVGGAAVEFQVNTGRMPAAARRGPDPAQAPAVAAAELAASQRGPYIQELGGGPQLPDKAPTCAAAATSPRGGELFRVNCSACHAFSGGGGALSSGKYAPDLAQATDRQIYAAMLTGPQNMPVFGDNQLSPHEKIDIIAYVQGMKEEQDPGGWGSAASARSPRAWPSSSSASSAWSSPPSGLRGSHEPQRFRYGKRCRPAPRRSERPPASPGRPVTEGLRRDDIEIVHYESPYPVPGTKAERRMERIVALMFLLSGVPRWPSWASSSGGR